jgi:hypothetical protein
VQRATCAPACAQVDGSKVVDTVNQVCSRGLRIKVGIDSGAAMDSVHPATGRMAYRGKVMNRAARIAAAASIAQVLHLCGPGVAACVLMALLCSFQGLQGPGDACAVPCLLTQFVQSTRGARALWPMSHQLPWVQPPLPPGT